MVRSGIYKIQSQKFPDRFYIGSTRDFDMRRRCHKSTLRHHTNIPKLRDHVEKYGVEDLIIIFIEKLPIRELAEKESYYIRTLSPYFNTNQVHHRTITDGEAAYDICRIGHRNNEINSAEYIKFRDKGWEKRKLSGEKKDKSAIEIKDKSVPIKRINKKVHKLLIAKTITAKDIMEGRKDGIIYLAERDNQTMILANDKLFPESVITIEEYKEYFKAS
jgi:group I intron endonuclease